MAKRMKLRSLKGMKSIAPFGVAAALTGATTLGLRAYLRPTPGETSEKLYRWAPAFGAGVGLFGAGLMYFLAGGKRGGLEAALATGVSSVAMAGFLIGSEKLNAIKPGAMLALSGGAVPSGTEQTGTAGLGALMPEYARPGAAGLGAIVMDRGVGGPIGGETVRVAGLGNSNYRSDAFGQSSF